MGRVRKSTRLRSKGEFDLFPSTRLDSKLTLASSSFLRTVFSPTLLLHLPEKTVSVPWTSFHAAFLSVLLYSTSPSLVSLDFVDASVILLLPLLLVVTPSFRTGLLWFVWLPRVLTYPFVYLMNSARPQLSKQRKSKSRSKEKRERLDSKARDLLKPPVPSPS